MQKGFAPIILLPFILIAILICYGIYWYTGSIINAPVNNVTPISTPMPTQDSTANWETITFPQQFSFKFPKDKLFPSLPVDCFTKTTNQVVFHAEFYLQKPSQSSEQLNCNYPGEDGSEFSVIVLKDAAPIKILEPEKSKPFQIGGINAILIYNRGTLGGTNQRLIYFQHNNLQYSIYIPTGPESGSEDKLNPLFTQILSTFKFTN